MILVCGAAGLFCLVGLSRRRFGARTRWLLLAGIVALVMTRLRERALLPLTATAGGGVNRCH